MEQGNVVNFYKGLELIVDAVLVIPVRPAVVLINGVNDSTRQELARGIMERLSELGYKGRTVRVGEDLKVATQDVTLSFLLLEDNGMANGHSSEHSGRVPDLRVYLGVPPENSEYNIIIQ